MQALSDFERNRCTGGPANDARQTVAFPRRRRRLSETLGMRRATGCASRRAYTPNSRRLQRGQIAIACRAFDMGHGRRLSCAARGYAFNLCRRSKFGVRMRLNAATNGAMRILMACRRDRLLSMPEMARKLGLGEAMVLKTCQELMRAGFIAGRRGRGGGYRLARSPDKITVMEIVDLFEPEENLFPCRLHIPANAGS